MPFSQIRFVTSHPRYMSPGVVDAVAASARICPAFHVPFQSGDDEVRESERERERESE